jgi:hypothetical protein
MPIPFVSQFRSFRRVNDTTAWDLKERGKEGWGGRRGLNPRHSVPQTDALPAELLPPLARSLAWTEPDGERSNGAKPPALGDALPRTTAPSPQTRKGNGRKIGVFIPLSCMPRWNLPAPKNGSGKTTMVHKAHGGAGGNSTATLGSQQDPTTRDPLNDAAPSSSVASAHNSKASESNTRGVV